MRSSWVLLVGLVAACGWFDDECEPVEDWCDGNVLKTCYEPDNIKRENCADYGAQCIEENSYVYCGYPEVECDLTAEVTRYYCFEYYLAYCSVYGSHEHPSPAGDCQERAGATCLQEPDYVGEYEEGAYCGYPSLDCPSSGWGEVCVGSVLSSCEGSAHPKYEHQCGEHDHDVYCVEDAPDEYDHYRATCAFHPNNCEPGDQACSPDFDFLWLGCGSYAYIEAYRCAPDLVCVEQGDDVGCE